MPTNKEIQQLHCEIAELMGWEKCVVSPSGKDSTGYDPSGEDGFEHIPQYTTDLNILLGEFAEWLDEKEMGIRIDFGAGHYYVEMSGDDPLTMLASKYSDTPQEAAYHAIKEALPRIKEIVKESSNDY